MRSKYVKSILIGTLATIASTTNAYAFAVQPDGYVDQSFVEAANDQLDLLPDYLIDAMEDDGLNIYITDKNIDSYFFGGYYGSVMGVTDTDDNGHTDIYIEDREKAVSDATIHEVGHWLDVYCGNVTSTGEFSQIYNAESNAFCNAFLVNFYYDVREFYAEGFWKYFTDPDILQENCPQLYATIDSNLAGIEGREEFTCG